MRSHLFLTCVIGLLTCGTATLRSEDHKPDDEGFIRNWIILAPIPLAEGQSGEDGLNREQIKEEGNLRPKAGDKLTIGGKELVWKAYQAEDYFINFNTFVGQQTDNAVAYAVCYITCEAPIQGLTLKMGSDDQAKVWLNGTEVIKYTGVRGIGKDQDSVDNITLNKGENVIVFKVVNELGDWAGCVRFVQPVKNLKLNTLQP